MPFEVISHRIKKAGMPPGSFIHLGPSHSSAKITIAEYGEEGVFFRDVTSLSEYQRDISVHNCLWIHLSGIRDIAAIKDLENLFGIHPLALEDVLNTTQRVKLDYYPSQLLIIMRLLEKKNGDKIQHKQISIVLGNNYIISFAEKEFALFDAIANRLKVPNSRIRRNGVDYLCYAIIDSIVDHQFEVLQCLDTEIEELEELLLRNTSYSTLERIQKAKRELSFIHKVIWPMRDVASQLIRSDSNLVDPGMRVYFHDVYDHVIQAIDTVEIFREITFGLVDLYMSHNAQKLNEIMKVLTIVSTIFVPLTFIASLYGMNFEGMPGIHWKWGFAIALSAMLASAFSMLFFFRRKKWI